jgi:hypothetical protein
MEQSQPTTRRYFVPVPAGVTDAHGLPVPDIEITRIDFLVTGATTTVNKMGMNVFEKTIVAEGKTHKNFDLAAALDWLRVRGWTVREWPGGARAWRDGLKPIRSAREIIRLRDELRAYPRPELEGKAHTLDLAFDL